MAERYKTGEKAPESGTYEFDGLVNESSDNNDLGKENHIDRGSGDTFPPTRSNKDEAYWKKSD
ncbi:general stress protein [Bacillus coahuilensis p1.1.43]|uniref:General stress protein n=1 Tax=Bacillus coahuilensis p1.1.43 TaxID=1150625 RepID=A0A147KBU1_9BACI|nr:YjzC family protein [Bacillus coahuilensis]KUP08839.1 general stress protein [Bacillus coahuilensis p1.1.43]